MATAKIAISLPKEVLQQAEQVRRSYGESRSEFIRRAIELLLRQERQREAVERYIQGYREMPETEEEIEAADRQVR